MEVGNDELARILGRLEAKMDEQARTSARVEEAVASVDRKVSQRLDEHDVRLRRLEVANPEKIAETVAAHTKRIEALEQSSVRNGVIAGIGSGVAMATIIELLKRKIGL